MSLQCHHFVRGCSRKANELATTAIACEECHWEEHNRDGIGLVGWMALKMVMDPTNYNRELVNELRHRAKDAISEKEMALEVAALFTRARK